ISRAQSCEQDSHLTRANAQASPRECDASSRSKRQTPNEQLLVGTLRVVTSKSWILPRVQRNAVMTPRHIT
ncbi:hypothetical protein A2U01_0063861, partial [Trifolium medium]|nr:hypothetical protein [Trifolium medium]